MSESTTFIADAIAAVRKMQKQGNEPNTIICDPPDVIRARMERLGFDEGEIYKVLKGITYSE